MNLEQSIIIGVLVVFCLILSFLFSGMEAGVLALSRLRIQQLMRAGNSNAQVLLGYLENPENFLWTILVGNTVANFAAVCLVVIPLQRWLEQWPLLLVACLIAMLFLFYAFCDLLPKMLFRMYPNRLTLALARPFRFIHNILTPLVWVMTQISRGFLKWSGGKSFTGLPFGSREEMRLVMQESSQGLTSEERAMINRVLDLQNLRVRDVAIPMSLVAVVTAQTRMGDALKLARERQVSRLPVWSGQGTKRRIAGILSLRAVVYQAELDPTKLAGDFVKPALYIDSETRLEAALKQMQRSGHRLGIVLGRDQREEGIVSLQDILKVIFGEVRF